MASANTRIRVTFAGPRVLAFYVLRFHDLTLAPCRPTARLVSALVSTAMFVVNSFYITTFVVFVKDVAGGGGCGRFWIGRFCRRMRFGGMRVGRSWTVEVVAVEVVLGISCAWGEEGVLN